MTRRKWVPPDVPFTRATSAVSKKGLYASIRRGDTRVILPGVFVSTAAWPQQPMAQHLVRALARQMRWPNRHMTVPRRNILNCRWWRNRRL